jgi:hypothetical protein
MPGGKSNENVQRLALLCAFAALVIITFLQQSPSPLGAISDVVMKLNHRYVNLSTKLRD